MNRDFECVWEELRPAPHVTIDFKNGYVLERTLNGNVATLFVAPEGGVFDILPGLMGKPTYASKIELIAERFRAARRSGVFSSDSVRADCESRAEMWRAIAPELMPPNMLDFDVEIAKGVVEIPIKTALGVGGKPISPSDQASLNADTRSVFTTLLPAALDLLAKHPLAAPEELTEELFRDILHVDLEDPYLGLAVDALGGRLGRFGPDAPDGPAKSTEEPETPR